VKFYQVGYLHKLQSLTPTTDLNKVAQVLSRLYKHKILYLLDNSPIYGNIINDPFKSFQLKSLLADEVIQDPLLEKLNVAAAGRYKRKLEVLNSLKEPTPFKAIDFNNLGKFRPYQDYIADSRRATKLFEEIKSNPGAYKTFASNQKQLKSLKYAAYSRLIPAE
jgi:hypothetical protein